MNLKVHAILDPQFAPLSVVCREMREATRENGQDLVIAIERNNGYTATYKTKVFADGTGHDENSRRVGQSVAAASLPKLN